VDIVVFVDDRGFIEDNDSVEDFSELVSSFDFVHFITNVVSYFNVSMVEGTAVVEGGIVGYIDV